MMFTLWHKRPRIDVKDSTRFFRGMVGMGKIGFSGPWYNLNGRRMRSPGDARPPLRTRKQ